MMSCRQAWGVGSMKRMKKTSIGVLVAGLMIPQIALAGGGEFVADGVIGIGRGGTGMTRADDGTVMIRNPALLADLWGDQLMLGSHLLFHDSCSQFTGAQRTQRDSVTFGDGQVYVLNADPDATTLDGEPLPSNLVDGDASLGQMDEGRYRPYPEVCYEGPIPYLPELALTMKLADDLGVGLAFFPPEGGSPGNLGRRDGTLETDTGLESDPSRYIGSAHTNASYFSLLGAVGYRPMPWLRVGAGFQWTALAVNVVGFSAGQDQRSPSGDVRTDTFLRDLFIPGFVASVHVVPMDAMDVMVGFKWQDSLKAAAKIDITTGVFGTGEAYTFINEDGEEESVGSRVPTTTHNIPGKVEGAPIWVPQLTFGVRYADRLKPRIRDWDAAKKAVGNHAVEDHMSSERWDIEAGVVVYLNGVRDVSDFINPGEDAGAGNVTEDGIVAEVSGPVGECVTPNDAGGCSEDDQRRRTRTFLRGKTAYSLRLGGDYNVLPGLFSVRAGISYETSGTEIEYFSPRYYDQERTGLHTGMTWRIGGVTDLSVGYALFIHPDIRLGTDWQGEEDTAPPYPEKYELESLHWIDPDDSSLDGQGKLAVPSPSGPADGPHWSNAGIFKTGLQVVSVQLTQHF